MVSVLVSCRDGQKITGGETVRDPCNPYTKEPFPQPHAGEHYTFSLDSSLSLSLTGGVYMHNQPYLRHTRKQCPAYSLAHFVTHCALWRYGSWTFVLITPVLA